MQFNFLFEGLNVVLYLPLLFCYILVVSPTMPRCFFARLQIELRPLFSRYIIFLPPKDKNVFLKWEKPIPRKDKK